MLAPSQIFLLVTLFIWIFLRRIFQNKCYISEYNSIIFWQGGPFWRNIQIIYILWHTAVLLRNLKQENLNGKMRSLVWNIPAEAFSTDGLSENLSTPSHRGGRWSPRTSTPSSSSPATSPSSSTAWASCWGQSSDPCQKDGQYINNNKICFLF